MRARGRTYMLTAALWLAVLAVLLRVLIPGGFMPAEVANASGAVLISCPGADPAVADAAPERSHKREGKAPRSADTLPCAFAGSTLPALAPAPAPEPALRDALRMFDSPRRVLTAGAADRMSSPPPPSHGPPQAIG
jgi:hypothetical protein